MDTASIIVSVIAVSGSIATVIISFRRDRSEIDKKNIDSLQTRVQLVEQEKEDVKKRLTVCEGLHRDNLSKQGKMEGVITTLERVLQNRNPQLEKVLDGLLKFMERIEKHMQTDHPLP